MEWLKSQLSNVSDEWRTKLQNLNLPEDTGQAWILIERKLGLTSEQLLEQVTKTGIETIELDRVGNLTAERIKESDARRFNVIAVRKNARKLVLASDNPFDDDFRREVGFALKSPVELIFTPPDQLSNALNRFYAADTGNAGRTLWVDDSQLRHEDVSPDEAVAKITQHILTEAVRLNASDIHIQSFMGGGLVRYRVDGLLMRGNSLPLSVKDSVLRYVLTQSALDISNHSTPQDGRLRVNIDGKTFDLRVSYLPSFDDARLVMRLLYQGRNFALSSLELPHHDRSTLNQLCHHTRGLILFTGPTGSGKTTSLYALLTQMNKPEINIMTAEDPVEYQLQGISQIEIDQKRGRTFDTILKSMLRQDPDVILVGEIRDAETAQMAMRAVMTGHLVLSTLHTQNALGAVQRLIDLGVTQGQLAEGLIAVIGQRLARKLCEHCAETIAEMRPLEQLFFDNYSERPGRRAIGCESCHYTGYKGRFPMVEIYRPDSKARERLRQKTYLSEPDLELKRDLVRVGTQAVVSGITSIEEITRVLGAEYWGRVNPYQVNTAIGMASEESDQRKASFMLIGQDQAWADRVATKLNYHIQSYPTGAAASAALRHDVLVVGLIVYVDTKADVRATLEEIRSALAWSGLPTIFILTGAHEELEIALKQHGIQDWCKGELDIDHLQRLCEEAMSY